MTLDKIIHLLAAVVGAAAVELLQVISPVEPPVFDNPGMVKVIVTVVFLVVYLLAFVYGQSKHYRRIYVVAFGSAMLAGTLLAGYFYYAIYADGVIYLPERSAKAYAIVIVPQLNPAGADMARATCTGARPAPTDDPNVFTVSLRCTRAMAVEVTDDTKSRIGYYLDDAAFEQMVRHLRNRYLAVLLTLALGLGSLLTVFGDKLAILLSAKKPG